MNYRQQVSFRYAWAAAALLLLVPTIGARTVAKTRHMGKQADGKGSWTSCSDVPARPPTPLALNAHYDGSKHSLTLTGNVAQAVGVFGAAFAECFMDDADENKPPRTDYNQYHDTTLSYAVIRIRPVAQAHRMSDALLARNTGYIVADFNVRAVIKPRSFASRPLGVVSEDHSALLWHGRDDLGTPYSALIDLRNFPATSEVTSLADVHIVASGGWIERPRTDKLTAAFARFTDPVRHSGRHRTPRRGPSMLEDELTIGHLFPVSVSTAWVSCDPGCCGVMDMLVF